MLSNFRKTGRVIISVLGLVFAVNITAQTPKPTEQASVKDAGPSSSPTKSTSSLTPSQIFSGSRASVVVIMASDQSSQNEALGSGFIVGNNKIVTNHHVLEGMSQAAVVFSDGNVKPVSNVIADSREQDLIVVTTQTGNRQPLSFGDELTLQQGDSVYALGAPKGLELSFTNGIVSSFRKSNSQFLIQTTAPIAPGSSGGPLFDHTGRVVGVTSSLLADAPGIYFSVGIGDVKRLLRTPQGVTLSLEEWAKQQGGRPPSQSANSSPDSQSDVTLQDTISWMTKFLDAHGQEWDGKTEPLQSNWMELLPSDMQLYKKQGCSVRVRHEFRDAAYVFADMKVPVKEDTDVLFLGQIDLSTIKVCAGSHVCAETVNNADNISVIVPIEGKNPFSGEKMPVSEYDVNRMAIILDTAENAQRFASALKHAVALCGGSKSAF